MARARMTIDDLIAALKDLRSQAANGGDTEVRLAQQPNWPFEFSLGAVELVDMNDDIDEDGAPAAADNDGTEPTEVVYIAEGRQLGYLAGAAARALGWK